MPSPAFDSSAFDSSAFDGNAFDLGTGASSVPVNPTVTIRPLIRCTARVRPLLSVVPTITK
jgi:hypothetical protein